MESNQPPDQRDRRHQENEAQVLLVGGVHGSAGGEVAQEAQPSQRGQAKRGAWFFIFFACRWGWGRFYVDRPANSFHFVVLHRCFPPSLSKVAKDSVPRSSSYLLLPQVIRENDELYFVFEYM